MQVSKLSAGKINNCRTCQFPVMQQVKQITDLLRVLLNLSAAEWYPGMSIAVHLRILLPF